MPGKTSATSMQPTRARPTFNPIDPHEEEASRIKRRKVMPAMSSPAVRESKAITRPSPQPIAETLKDSIATPRERVFGGGLLDPLPSVPMQPPDLRHGCFVRISGNGAGWLADNARYADMNQGLVIAQSDTKSSGVASNGFACCFAIVIRSPHAVGLAHTSQPASCLLDEILSLGGQFKAKTGSSGTLSLGYSVAGYREDMEREIDSTGLADFIDGQNFNDSLPPEAIPTTRENAIQQVLDLHVASITEFAETFGYETFDMPKCAVYVPIEGQMRLFEQLQAEPVFTPLRSPAAAEKAPR